LESATLVGMLKGTSYYNPVLNPERAKQRRNLVLGQMVKHNKLDPKKLEALKKRPLKVDFERQTEPLGASPHLTQFLRRWLIDWADRNDYNIYADGLVVRTTIDSRLQKFANEAVARQGDRLQGVANNEWGPRAWAGKRDLVRALVREAPDYKAAKEQGEDDEAIFKRLLADISPNVVAALISTEDHRFYDHHGLDFTRIGGAVLSTFGGDLQGGSTITQQLARNLYPEEVGRSRSLTRKFKEIITALKIEAIYSKDEILETYLNTVPFLYNAYGIEMAARTYFDKSADKLDVLESATLVGMLKGTSYYNPVLNPERAKQRRNLVLGQMVKHNKLDPKK
ncbi:MAG: transglycosylase domain-containing protein, partial [Polaromonas sp.]|nr:transglycosylase domain-containing protein [Polaromonas sp.]